MIEVKENDDGTFDISWDENDPYESMFNDWTEQDFINALMEYAKKILDNTEEPSNHE